MAKPKPKFPDYQKCMFCPRRAWGGRLGSWLVSDEGGQRQVSNPRMSLAGNVWKRGIGSALTSPT